MKKVRPINEGEMLSLLREQEQKMQQALNVFTNKNIKFHLLNLARNKARHDRLTKSIDKRFALLGSAADHRCFTKERFRPWASQREWNNSPRKEPEIPDLLPRELVESLIGTAFGKSKLDIEQSLPSTTRNNFAGADLTYKQFRRNLSRTPVHFKSPINKIQFELLETLNGFKKGPEEKMKPSADKVTAILEMLEKISEEKSVFQGYMVQVVQELRCATFCKMGEFAELFIKPLDIDLEGTF